MSVAVVAMILPAQFQAVVASTCCCPCCAIRADDEAEPAEGSACTASEASWVSDSSGIASDDHGPCCIGKAHPSDRTGCGTCKCHTKWHAVAALRAGLTGLKKPDKQWAHVPPSKRSSGAFAPTLQRLAPPDGRPGGGCATQVCAALCRFLL